MQQMIYLNVGYGLLRVVNLPVTLMLKSYTLTLMRPCVVYVPLFMNNRQENNWFWSVLRPLHLLPTLFSLYCIKLLSPVAKTWKGGV